MRKQKPAQNSRAKRPYFLRMLDYVEIVGNKLPHPATLFAGLALLVVWMSCWEFRSDRMARCILAGE